MSMKGPGKWGWIATAALGIGSTAYLIKYGERPAERPRCKRAFYTGTGYPICVEYEKEEIEKDSESKNKPK